MFNSIPGLKFFKVVSFKTIVVILLLTLYSIPTNAQYWGKRKYEFYYGLGATNFMADVGAHKTLPIWVNFFNTIGYTANTGLRYNFYKRHYTSANFALGQLYAADVANNAQYWYYDGRQARSFFSQVSVRYEFMIINERRKQTVYRQLGETWLKNVNIPTYIFIGAGGMFNIGKFSMIEGKERNSEKFNNFTGIIPFGFGFKYRLNPNTFLNIEAVQHWTLSDKLDNVTINQYGGGAWIDQYQFITFNIVYKLRSNSNGLPRFKRR